MTWAYARVSSKEQNEARQIDAFHAQGIEDEQIVVDKESGKDFDRTHYRVLRRRLKEGDTLVVLSLDRFGRNYEMIIDEWRYLTKDKGVTIKVLDMPILNTTEESGLTGKLVAEIVLQLLSYVAQMERDHIHKRQAEGIAAAKARGVKFGRESMTVPVGFNERVSDWEDGKCSLRSLCRDFGVSHPTIEKWLRQFGAKKKSSYRPPRINRVIRKTVTRKHVQLEIVKKADMDRIRSEIFAPFPEDKPIKEVR